jgi:hypothetical protein
MSQREIRKLDSKWAIIAIVGAIAVAAGLSGALDSVDLTPQVVDRVDSTPFGNGLGSGPVAGMPKSTFDELTAGNIAIGLNDGPVAGMPRDLYERLAVRADAPAGLSEGPVPGMPQYIYEQLAG